MLLLLLLLIIVVVVIIVIDCCCYYSHHYLLLKKTRHENLALFMGACVTPPNLAIITRYIYYMNIDTYSIIVPEIIVIASAACVIY